MVCLIKRIPDGLGVATSRGILRSLYPDICSFGACPTSCSPPSACPTPPVLPSPQALLPHLSTPMTLHLSLALNTSAAPWLGPGLTLILPGVWHPVLACPIGRRR